MQALKKKNAQEIGGLVQSLYAYKVRTDRGEKVLVKEEQLTSDDDDEKGMFMMKPEATARQELEDAMQATHHWRNGIREDAGGFAIKETQQLESAVTGARAAKLHKHEVNEAVGRLEMIQRALNLDFE